jgi:hypothetical protein
MDSDVERHDPDDSVHRSEPQGLTSADADRGTSDARPAPGSKYADQQRLMPWVHALATFSEHGGDWQKLARDRDVAIGGNEKAIARLVRYSAGEHALYQKSRR